MRRVTLYIISDSSCEEAEAEHVKGQLVHVISDSDLMCRKTQNWTFISRNSDKEHIWILMENMIKVPMKPKLLFKCVTPSLTYTPASGTKKLLWRYFNGILEFATSWKKIIKLLMTHPAIGPHRLLYNNTTVYTGSCVTERIFAGFFAALPPH